MDWNDAPPYDAQNWGLTILTNGDAKSRDFIKPYSERRSGNVLAAIERAGSGDQMRKLFRMPSDGYVDVHALGEGMHGEMFDYAWIEVAETHEQVWRMEYRNTSPAGGAQKNRQADTRIYLKKGDYLLYYQTDGSHAFGDWNDEPPFDPSGWGVSVTLSSDENSL
jgi:hypothetical protein